MCVCVCVAWYGMVSHLYGVLCCASLAWWCCTSWHCDRVCVCVCILLTHVGCLAKTNSSLTHSLNIHSLLHLLTLTHPLTHALTLSLTHQGWIQVQATVLKSKSKCLEIFQVQVQSLCYIYLYKYMSLYLSIR